MVELPPEIWTNVFSLVSANQMDVSSCRLVCKDFDEQSRPFLISRLCVAFRRRSDMERLEYLAALPHLADTVHTLVVDARGYVPEQSRQHDHLAAEFRSIEYEWTWVDAVARALPSFRNVRAIETATEAVEQESPRCRIRWYPSESWPYVLDFISILAKTRSSRFDKIRAMTLGSPEEGMSPTDIIDYRVKCLPDDCVRFLCSQKQRPRAAMLSFAFQWLVSLQISLDIKEWEVAEIGRKQPLRPMWQSCHKTLERLILGLVWRSCEEDPDGAAGAAAERNDEDEDDEDEDDEDEDGGDDIGGRMIGSPVNEKALHAVIDGLEFPRLRGLTLVGWKLKACTWGSFQSGFPSLHKVHFVDGARDDIWHN